MAKTSTGLLILILMFVVEQAYCDDVTKVTLPYFTIAQYDDDNKLTLYLQAVMETVYLDLGYQADIQRFPVGRSRIEANAGRTDAIMALTDPIDIENVENLVKVEFPLMKFTLYEVIPKGLEQTSKPHIVGLLRGAKKDLLYAQNQAYVISQFATTQSLILALIKKRVDSIVMTNFEIESSGTINSADFHLVPIQTYMGFHYVHSSKASMKSEIRRSLIKLMRNGTLDMLMDKFQIGESMKPDWQAFNED